MDQRDVNTGLRIPVGTHYRVWWFWLPVIFAVLTLVAGAVLFPIMPRVGVWLGVVCVLCTLAAVISGWIIERGRRWVEIFPDRFHLSDRYVQTVILDEQVTALAIDRQALHGAGKLLAETRSLLLWIVTETGPQRVSLTSRMAPDDVDPLRPLIDRLCRRLFDKSVQTLGNHDSVEGEGWSLDADTLHLTNRQQQLSIPVDELTAVETLRQEIRIWQRGNPYTVARLPLSGRDAWLLEQLLVRSLAEQRMKRTVVTDVLPDDPLNRREATGLGRILFERSAGRGVTVLFGVLGLLLALVGGVALLVAVPVGEGLLMAVGGMLVLLSLLCFAGGIRVQRVRFRCRERGLERITMLGRKELLYEDIDVFSFESRRNQSHGRYTGTTYTVVFADRSREQGRGIFYSTTIRNPDEELEDLRERVSEIIARRIAQAFAAHRSVQWTPELWFHHDALEFRRPRRLFIPKKVVIVPYDSITDFEVRDGQFHVWTSYQERAILSLPSGAPNFYPGLIVLAGLVRTQRSPSSRQPSAAAATT